MAEIDCRDLETAAGRVEDALRFDRLPGTTKLFTDFIYDYSRVADFYTDYGRADSPLPEHARQVASLDYDREGVCEALERINQRAGSGPLTFEHINVLRQKDSVAIVTGQQAGLFTGPLYTIHKALTAIKLAACLRDQGVSAVPVFWVASEDHDYQEVNHCKVVDSEGVLKEVRYEGCGHNAEIPVGEVHLCEGIDNQIRAMMAALPKSEFSASIENDLRETYKNGVGFAEAFASLMARIFRNYGVVLLDPLDEDLKRIASPIYRRAIEESENIAHAIVARSEALIKAGYHAQVHVSNDMVPLFKMHEGRRVAMTRHEDRFYLKGTSRSYSKDELLKLATEDSREFSPNVTFRPVVQDFLIPTAAYIGGPAEIAYFAQVNAVYETIGRPLPCVLPRSSVTIVEGKHQKTMQKYGLQLSDFFEGLHPAVSKVVEQSLDRETALTFEETERMFNEQLDRLEQALKRTDGTLAASVKNTRDKILYQVEHLRTRFVHTAAKRDEVVYRQVERAYTSLYPEKNFQERELNVFYFLSKYGPSLIDDLYAAADVGFSNHRLVNIGGVASQVLNAG